LHEDIQAVLCDLRFIASVELHHLVVFIGVRESIGIVLLEIVKAESAAADATPWVSLRTEYLSVKHRFARTSL